MTYEHGAVLGTLMPLAGCILATTFVFGVVLSWRPSAAGWIATMILPAMLVFSVVIYHVGVNSRGRASAAPSVYGVAMVVVFYFLLPSAFAVPIHWLLLRGAKRSPLTLLGGEG